MTPVEMHLHSYSLRFHFMYRKDFDVFSFIDLAAQLGFTGVNISANGPDNRHLGGTTSQHYAAVRAALQTAGLKAELDTSDTRPEHLLNMLSISAAVGAEQLRVYTRYKGEKDDIIRKTISDLRTVAEAADTYRVTVVLENHEDFSGSEIRTILDAIDHPRIRALYDYGNSQMIREEPQHALQEMEPYITAVHLKDHLILEEDDQLWVQGVAVGDGNLPIMDLTRQLLNQGLQRLCFENVWGYIAPVQDTGAALPDTPTFSIEPDTEVFDGLDMKPELAVEGEYDALLRGWNWLQSQLQQNDIRITTTD